MRIKWTLEHLAEGRWLKLTCNPVPRIPRFREMIADVLETFDDVASEDYMVHTTDGSGCVVFAVRNDVDAVALQLLLPPGAYRGEVKLRREQRAALARRAS